MTETCYAKKIITIETKNRIDDGDEDTINFVAKSITNKISEVITQGLIDGRIKFDFEPAYAFENIGNDTKRNIDGYNACLLVDVKQGIVK